MSKKAVLLINLGTPEEPTEQAVRTYLKEFLWDPNVVQLPRVLWWLILNGIVLKTRPRQSALAYQRVWTKDGSPLLSHSKKIMQGLQSFADDKYPNKYHFFLGMRYGSPSISSAISAMQDLGVDEITILPLYPQYATSSSKTAIEAAEKSLSQYIDKPPYRVINQYFDNPSYIFALANRTREHWEKIGRSAYLLMSFHGVPERTIRQGDPYYDHCKKTAELLAEELALNPADWSMAFQSRFGKAKWIQPYCLDTLQQLPNNGVVDIDVICPGFAVDCLETLDEIAIENKAIFLAAGGRSYHYIAALNDNQDHISALFSLLMDQ